MMNYKRVAFQLSLARVACFSLVATGFLQLLQWTIMPLLAFYLLLFIISVVLFIKGWNESYKWDLLTVFIIAIETMIIFFGIFIWVAFALDDTGWSFG